MPVGYDARNREVLMNAAADEADIARISAPEIEGAGYLLAPDIVEAILDGRQPEGMNLPGLMEAFPVEWERQRVPLYALSSDVLQV